MKAILIILISSLCFFVTYAQQDDEQPVQQSKQKLTKEQKAERRLQEEAEQAQLIDTMISLHRFVLEADYLNTSSGNRITVNSTLNFIAIDSASGIIQLGRNTGLGANGVGGITIEGSVNKYEVTKTVKKNFTSYYVAISVFTSLGTFDISMQISSVGTANARLSGNQGYIVEYSGKLVPIGVSRVYKGHTLF